MTYEQFHQSVVLSYINHDGDPIRFFDDVVAALNQFREEKQAAQQGVHTDPPSAPDYRCICGRPFNHQGICAPEKSAGG